MIPGQEPELAKNMLQQTTIEGCYFSSLGLWGFRVLGSRGSGFWAFAVLEFRA